MTKNEWIQLAEEKHDKIIEKLIEAYTWAAGTKASSWWREVHLCEDGSVHITDLMTPGTICIDICDGTAVLVGWIKEFNAFDEPGYEDSVEGMLDFRMNEDGKEYVKWCRENGEHVGTEESMNRWKPGLWERFLKTYLEDYVSSNAQEWAEEQFDKFLNEMRNSEF